MGRSINALCLRHRANWSEHAFTYPLQDSRIRSQNNPLQTVLLAARVGSFFHSINYSAPFAASAPYRLFFDVPLCRWSKVKHHRIAMEYFRNQKLYRDFEDAFNWRRSRALHTSKSRIPILIMYWCLRFMAQYIPSDDGYLCKDDWHELAWGQVAGAMARRTCSLTMYIQTR